MEYLRGCKLTKIWNYLGDGFEYSRIGDFIQLEDNDISLEFQFRSSKNITFSGSMQIKKVPPVEIFCTVYTSNSPMSHFTCPTFAYQFDYEPFETWVDGDKYWY